VLALSRHQELLQAPDTGATPELDEKIKLRAPYVAPLNILQVRPRLFCAQFVVWCLALKH
jgi:phosphoenolpyruvate carboxylase